MKSSKDEDSLPRLIASNEDQNHDLGFGSVVASESRQRLLNRDGSFNVDRTGLSFWSSFSLYHSLLTNVVVEIPFRLNNFLLCLE